MEGLESVFGVARICGISTEDFVKMQTENIQEIFNIPMPSINNNEKANITLFSPDEEYVLKKKIFFQNAKTMHLSGKN